MKRISIPIVAILATAVATVAVQAASPTVKVASTRVGKILETSSGDTLYTFAKDSKNTNKCAAISGCTALWPMLTAAGKPVAGPGVKRNLLGTIKVGSKTQVTYAGHPLYLFADEKKGTAYVGVSEFGGKWEAITAAGKSVK